MYKELENKEFDYVIFGTSITESIISAHLAKCGKKIIQFEISKFYGGDCKNYSYKDLDNCRNYIF
jgi:RAB protein geranylgeranyltransferase component A